MTWEDIIKRERKISSKSKQKAIVGTKENRTCS
jgi:hypothetical protein